MLFKQIIEDKSLAILLKNGGISFLFKLIGIVASYVFLYLISKYYGASGVGFYEFAMVMILLFSYFCTLGLESYIHRFVHHEAKWSERKRKWFYKKSIASILILSVFITIIFSSIYFIAMDENLKRTILGLIILVIPMALLKFLSNIYLTENKVWRFNLLQNNFLFIGASLFLLVINIYRNSTFDSLLGLCVVSIFATILALWHNRTYVTISKWPFNPVWNDVIKKSFPLLIGSLAYFLLSWIDKIMLGVMMNEQSLGIYSVSWRISNLITFGLVSITAINGPLISSALSESRKNLIQICKDSSNIAFIFASGIFIFIWVTAQFLLGLFGDGSDFLDGERSLKILSFSQLVTAFSGTFLIVLNMGGHQIKVQNLLISGIVINAVLNFFLIPKMGIEGAAWATLVSTFIWNIWGLILGKRLFGFWLVPGKR